MPDVIRFDRVSDEYGFQSNFAGDPIELDGRTGNTYHFAWIVGLRLEDWRKP